MLGNHDSLYFAIIPLTPTTAKPIILGSPKDSPRFGQKRKITIHPSLFTCHYSPVTIHWYYSPLLFTPKFCLFKGGCPLYLIKCFLCLVQDFFFRESFLLRAFLCENILAYTSYSTKLVTPKPCNNFQTCNHYYCKCLILLSITSNFSIMFATCIILFVATATLVGLPPSRTVL